MIAGVCGGLGNYFNVDPNIVRIGFVLLSLFYGTGLFAYIALALFAPLEELNQ
jgi:phage shock protein C